MKKLETIGFAFAVAAAQEVTPFDPGNPETELCNHACKPVPQPGPTQYPEYHHTGWCLYLDCYQPTDTNGEPIGGNMVCVYRYQRC